MQPLRKSLPRPGVPGGRPAGTTGRECATGEGFRGSRYCGPSRVTKSCPGQQRLRSGGARGPQRRVAVADVDEEAPKVATGVLAACDPAPPYPSRHHHSRIRLRKSRPRVPHLPPRGSAAAAWRGGGPGWCPGGETFGGGAGEEEGRGEMQWQQKRCQSIGL